MTTVLVNIISLLLYCMYICSATANDNETTMKTDPAQEEGLGENLTVIITAVGTCLVTSLVIGVLCCIIAALHHSRHMKERKKEHASQLYDDYELKG